MDPTISAAIFDYGGVLSLPVDPGSLAKLARWCGMPLERFRQEHMLERLAYDRADVDLAGYWSRILGATGRDGRTIDRAFLDRLNREDLRGWSRINPRVLSWSRELRAAGFRTAVLSNMPQPVLDLMLAEARFAWLSEFPVRVFSCEVLTVKPEPGIYRHLLERLGEAPERCVFLDDNADNVAGARAAGINAFLFRSAEEAAGELAALGLPVAGLVGERVLGR